MSEQILSGAAGENTQPAERTAQTVALEIRTLQRQAQGIILTYAVEIGRRLEEAKAMLPHGSWGAWLKEELDYSPSTAQNFMRVYREYGDGQQSMFGASKSQTFGILTYSKALRLLAIPDEEERAQFVEENDVEHMSVRELEEAIRARDAAQEEAALLKDRIAEQARAYEAKLAASGRDAQAAEKERDELRRKLEERPVAADKAAVENARKAAMDEMTAKVEKAVAARMQAENDRKAAETALEDIQRELDALKAQAAEQKTAPTDEARLRELKKRLAAADPDVAEFKVRYASWQEEFQKMMAVLGRMEDSGQAAKLRNAVAAAVAQMGGI